MPAPMPRRRFEDRGLGRWGVIFGNSHPPPSAKCGGAERPYIDSRGGLWAQGKLVGRRFSAFCRFRASPIAANDPP